MNHVLVKESANIHIHLYISIPVERGVPSDGLSDQVVQVRHCRCRNFLGTFRSWLQDIEIRGRVVGDIAIVREDSLEKVGCTKCWTWSALNAAAARITSTEDHRHQSPNQFPRKSVRNCVSDSN